MIPVGMSMFICVHYYHSCSNDPRWHEQDYIHPPYHHFIHCRHRNDGPHLCEDVRLYPDGNLNALVCLLSSFLIYVSLKRLIIDGASIVMSMLITLHREQPNCTSPCSNFLVWSCIHIDQFPKINIVVSRDMFWSWVLEIGQLLLFWKMIRRDLSIIRPIQFFDWILSLMLLASLLRKKISEVIL